METGRNLMNENLPLTGGCQCGHVRYEVSKPPITLYCCHCTECQAQSSSAFGMSLRICRDALAIDWSAMSCWSRSTDSGGTMDCYFCPECGTRLVHAIAARSNSLSIKAGSLDRRKELMPVGHIWTGSAQNWVRFGDDMLVASGDPVDFTPYQARWNRIDHAESR